ncbi:hypothetical protein L1049_027545 [Liquidambar formosana]|uniref:Homologous recombination OB-fold protein OB-fold domain-containing protein n=1 Tax=Liquidambar formosana TaxID=63359 RepID=A0AAP0WVJ3_LIQFO
MESWEALDVDDSDLPSLLRPCKRQHHQSPSKTTTTTTTTSSQLLLQQSQSIPQTLLSQSQHSLPCPAEAPPPPPSTASPRLIPGPARAVQAAMHRRTFNNQMSCPGDEDPIPTLEYLRRAVEDGNNDEDEDFTRNPWLSAVDFARRHGSGDGLAIGTPLCSIKDCQNIARVPQVVAIIKSCNPNGLGDLMVNLKDPTGTIGASIHQRVIAEGEFGREITVGAVLILQKVVVFSPSRSAHYLNITLSNVVKVISKDSGPPSRQNCSAPVVNNATSATGECGGRPGMPQKAFSLVQRRTEGVLNEARETINVRGSAQNDIQMEKSDPAPGSSCYSNRNTRNQNASVEREPLLTRQDAAKAIAKLAVRKDTNDNDIGVAVDNPPNSWKQADGDNLLGSIQCNSTATNLVEVPADQDQEVRITNGVKKQRQPLIARASLPQWTDEQLDELFAVDCDNDISLV